jgi:hypothetical protein
MKKTRFAAAPVFGLARLIVACGWSAVRLTLYRSPEVS